MTRARLPELPTHSVAEFRKAAWPVLDRNLAGRIVMRIYFTWGALGVGITLLVLGAVGLVEGVPASLGVFLVGVLTLGLAALRAVRQLRLGAANRQAIDALSREVDARAAHGQIPAAPSGWQEGVLPAPHERASSWM